VEGDYSEGAIMFSPIAIREMVANEFMRLRRSHEIGDEKRGKILILPLFGDQNPRPAV
jgi:hypothetical protein